MSMRRNSVDRRKLSSNNLSSDDSEILSKQWEIVSSRVSQMERHITILQKKHLKLEKRFTTHAQEMTQLNIEIAEEINTNKILIQNSNQQIQNQVNFTISNLKREIKEGVNLQISDCISKIDSIHYQCDQTINHKTKTIFQQSRSYVDRAVGELKQLLRKYVKEQSELQVKIQRNSSKEKDASSRILASPKRRTNQSIERNKSNSKSLNNINQQQQYIKQRTSVEKKIKVQGASPTTSINSSRVSYLKQKLKQFQKINKKYETPIEKEIKKQEPLLDKMRTYKQYLQQSQSEIDQSNFNIQEHQYEHYQNNFQRGDKKYSQY